MCRYHWCVTATDAPLRLVEVNTCPDLSASSPLDRAIKGALFSDVVLGGAGGLMAGVAVTAAFCTWSGGFKLGVAPAVSFVFAVACGGFATGLRKASMLRSLMAAYRGAGCVRLTRGFPVSVAQLCFDSAQRAQLNLARAVAVKRRPLREQN